MTKKVLLALLLCTCLIGCSKDADTTTAGSTQAETTEAATETDMAATEAESVSEEATTEAAADPIASYSITESPVVNEMGYKILFPQLSGGIDEVCSFYNQLWRDLANDFMMQNMMAGNSNCSLHYQVMTHTDEMLSLLFTEETTAKDAAYPTLLLYTYNINLRTGESILLAPEAQAQIAKKLADGEFTLPADYTHLKDYQDQIFAGADADTLKERLAAADYRITYDKGGLILGEDHVPVEFTYYEDGELRILVQVVHALGDYVAVIPAP